jgi:hypothetical protein
MQHVPSFVDLVLETVSHCRRVRRFLLFFKFGYRSSVTGYIVEYIDLLRTSCCQIPAVYAELERSYRPCCKQTVIAEYQ